MAKLLSSTTRYALFTLLIFSPLARGSVQGWAVTIIHMVTLVALAAFLLEKSLSWSWEWIKTPLDKPIICILVLCLLSSVFSMHRTASFWAVVLLLNYVAVFYLIIHAVRTRSQFRQLIYLIVGVAAFLSIFGLFKLSGTNPFPWWDYSDIPPKFNRLAATYGNPNHLAGYMEMVIPLLLGLLLTDFRGIKLFSMICLTFLLLKALIFSLSRGGWFGAFTGLFFMAFVLIVKRSLMGKRLLVTSICGFFAVIFICGC